MKHNHKTITELARELRKAPTPSEKMLWSYLRKKQLMGLRFLRQKPIVYNHRQNERYFFIADFYCVEFNLVIELDGKVHDYEKEYDLNRDKVLNNLGIKTLRIKNEDLTDIEAVLVRIKEYVLDN